MCLKYFNRTYARRRRSWGALLQEMLGPYKVQVTLAKLPVSVAFPYLS
jgi:hypothetical protein